MGDSRMWVYFTKHKDVLIEFCEKEDLNYETILHSPRGVGKDYVIICYLDPQKVDNVPADILMWIWKDEERIFKFEVTELGREILTRG